MIKTDDFNLRYSIESGQPLAFHSEYKIDKSREHLRYVTDKGIINMTCTDNSIIDYTYVGGYTKAGAKREITSRLGIDDDIKKIYEKIDTDKFMSSAIKDFYGMRITKNDPWETTLCFVVSQFNNIKRIRGIVKKLIENFGEEYEENGKKIKLFPKVEALAKADIASINACGTGFRAKYIKSVATACTTRVDLQELYEMDYIKARSTLTGMHGIGDKVADCILLFGYKKLEAFPIDLWVKRTVEHIYFNDKKQSIKKIHEFAKKRFDGMAGYAQQYIFWQGRKSKIG